MNNRSLKRGIIAALCSLLFSIPVMTRAASTEAVFENPLTGKAGSIGLAAAVGLVVRGILGVSGILAIIFIIVGGIRIIAAHGNEDAVKQGTQTLLWAVVGLAVAFVGYVLVGAVVQRAGLFFGQS